MVGAAADLMSIHLMEGCVAMVTQPGDFVLVSGGDVFHLRVNKLTVQPCCNIVMDSVV